jgi:hypothetical protein
MPWATCPRPISRRHLPDSLARRLLPTSDRSRRRWSAAGWDDAGVDGSDEAQELLEEIRTLRRQLGEHLATEVELPEPGPVLDLKSRSGNTARIYKHIAQLSTGHALHFQYANWIKLAMLMDGFVTAVETDNSLMEYAAGRGMLELNAHTHTVMTRLQASADRITMTNWQDLGE